MYAVENKECNTVLKHIDEIKRVRGRNIANISRQQKKKTMMMNQEIVVVEETIDVISFLYVTS